MRIIVLVLLTGVLCCPVGLAEAVPVRQASEGYSRYLSPTAVDGIFA